MYSDTVLGHFLVINYGLELGIYGKRGDETPNDPKLSDRDPEARACAKRREAKARPVLGFMAGSTGRD